MSTKQSVHVKCARCFRMEPPKSCPPAAVRRRRTWASIWCLFRPQPSRRWLHDYGQYQYEQKKKQHDAKKKQHVVQVKELKFRPNTDDHDYDFKKNHAIRFLQEGNRVKAVVQFRGREIAHTDLGRKLLLRFAEDLVTYGAVDGTPRMEGRNAHILISPVKVVVKAPAKEKPPSPPTTPPASAPPAGTDPSHA